MKKPFLTTILLLFTLLPFAQEKDKKEKKSVKEIINQLPDMLIAQPDAGTDSNANRLISDNMYIVINPLWRETGAQTFTDFKLEKTDVEPLKNTFPLADKKIVQSLTINLGNVKKSVADKKQAVITQIKNHIAAYYKEAGTTVSAQDINVKANAMVISSESLTTTQGKQGEMFYMNDIQTNQSNFIVLFLIPGANPNACSFVQITYTHYTYETTLPDDILELKMFVYPEDQQTYIDFTKGILKSLKIQ